MGQFPICKLKWDLFRTSVTACTIDKTIFSAQFGIFYVKKEIWEQIFQERSYKTPKWGTSHLQTTISKWDLPQWGLQSSFGYVCSQNSWCCIIGNMIKQWCVTSHKTSEQVFYFGSLLFLLKQVSSLKLFSTWSIISYEIILKKQHIPERFQLRRIRKKIVKVYLDTWLVFS